MPKIKTRKSEAGFTLIELMVTVAIIGITTAMWTPLMLNAIKLRESEVALQKAVTALRSKVEEVRIMEAEELKKECIDGIVLLQVDDTPQFRQSCVASEYGVNGLIKVEVFVAWHDERIGDRSIHTEVLRGQ